MQRCIEERPSAPLSFPQLEVAFLTSRSALVSWRHSKGLGSVYGVLRTAQVVKPSSRMTVHICMYRSIVSVPYRPSAE